MGSAPTASIRLFGKLHTLRSKRGLPTELLMEVPPEGLTGEELLAILDLPVGEVEGLFCNHKVYGLGHRISAGDQVAFVPRGTPGPHRFALGLFAAGRSRD